MKTVEHLIFDALLEAETTVFDDSNFSLSLLVRLEGVMYQYHVHQIRNRLLRELDTNE